VHYVVGIQSNVLLWNAEVFLPVPDRDRGGEAKPVMAGEGPIGVRLILG
jgi:hypothetical protein